ncbi:hypothetical protein BGZ54_001162 [Gamsiella multidivaricata]|nr:hypothetical protein BGZ54_001162 [Gamsiella multidivaricata]
MTALASLQNLRGLAWVSPTEVRIDDVPFMLKSCRKLKSLVLRASTLVEEFTDSKKYTDLVKANESQWANSSLQSLSLDHQKVERCLFQADDFKRAGPWIRRLFQHIPNFDTIKFLGCGTILPWGWYCILSDRTNMQRVEIDFTPSASRYNARIIPVTGGAELLNALSESCPNLKLLDITRIPYSPSVAFEKFMRVNDRHLQTVSLKHSDFSDLALSELARLPPSTLSAPHSLVDLELGGCGLTTSSSAILILENYALLRSLNLLSTMARTIHLFTGSKPWPCAKVLEKFSIAIQPIEFCSPLKLYMPEEQQLTRERLCSFTSLLLLDFRGEASTFEIAQDFSFAPNLRKMTLWFMLLADEDKTYNRVSAAVEEHKEALFPGSSDWDVMWFGGYARRRPYNWPPEQAHDSARGGCLEAVKHEYRYRWVPAC